MKIGQSLIPQMQILGDWMTTHQTKTHKAILNNNTPMDNNNNIIMIIAWIAVITRMIIYTTGKMKRELDLLGRSMES